jgi:hypothetical protein
LLNNNKALYVNTSIVIKMENKSKYGTLVMDNQGLRQGCGLYPLPFDLYINAVLDVG